MREYFISDENKRYEEHSAAREHGRSAEYFRGEEVYRSPEFPSEGEKKSGASRRRTRVFTDRLLAGGIAPVVCAVAGGTVIAAAVVVAMAIKITVLAAVLTMTGISVDFKIEHVGSSSLVLTVSGGGFVDEIPLSSKDDIYSVSFAGLQPGTDYLFVIEDGEGGQLFSEVYSTLPYEATLTVVEKSVMPQSILLQFEEVPDTQFKVTLNGKPVECSLSEDFPVLAVEGLLPEGEYEILVADAETGDWLYREMIETPYMVLYDFSATARQTRLELQAYMVIPDGHHIVFYIEGEGVSEQVTRYAGEELTAEITGLEPNAQYSVRIDDDRGEQLFSEVYSTLPYEPTLTVVEKSVMPQSIWLQFEEVPDTPFAVTINGNPAETSLAADYPLLELVGLMPEAEYDIFIYDTETGDWLYREVIGTPYMLFYDFTASARQTVIYTQAIIDMAEGQYVIFRLEGGGRSEEIKKYYGDDLTVDFTGLEPETAYTLQIEDDRGEILSEREATTNPVETTLTATVAEETLNSLTLQFEGEMGTARLYDVYIDGQLSELKLSGQDGLLVLENLEAGRTYSVVIRDEYNYDYLFIGEFATPVVVFTFLEREAGEMEVMVTFTLENPDAREVTLVLSGDGEEQVSYSTAEAGEQVAYFSVSDLFAEYQLDVYLDDGTLIYSEVLEAIQIM